MKSLSNTSHHNYIPYYSFLPLTLLSLTIVSGIMLSSSIVSADNDTVIDQVNITVPVSCTLSGNGMNSHNAEISNGQYNSAIGETTLKAFCNDNEGFAIYAIGYTDNEDGKNVLTNSTLGSTYDIETGTAISGSTSDWAMKLATITSPTPTYPIIIAGSTDDTEKAQGDPDYSTFQEVPDDYAKVAYRTAATDIGINAEGSTFKTTYQAYISKTQPAGTYTGQVKYTLAHPHDATAPRKLVIMQNVNEWKNTVTLGEEITAIDSRDGKSYTVARLADGNLWMTQNLDHDIVTDGSVTYDNTTTDLGWNSSTGSYNTASWTPSTATYETGVTTWNWSNTIPESYDPGQLYWNGVLKPTNQASCETAGGTWNVNEWSSRCDTSNIAFTSSTGDSHYHLGNYYNWTVALAMNDSSSYETDGQTIDQSICPTGWTLPKAGSITTSGSFQYLIERYGWDSSTQTMNNPTVWNSSIKVPLSGTWGGSLSQVGEYGVFFSPQVHGGGGTYSEGLTIKYDNIVRSDWQVLRFGGESIRCVSRY